MLCFNIRAPEFQFNHCCASTAVSRSQRTSDSMEASWRLERNEVDDALGLSVGRCHGRTAKDRKTMNYSHDVMLVKNK